MNGEEVEIGIDLFFNTLLGAVNKKKKETITTSLP